MPPLNLSDPEDELTRDQALTLLREAQSTRARREGILPSGYPGYDTSVGGLNYPDEPAREDRHRAIDAGHTAMKLKVGSPEPERDLRRSLIVREVRGDAARVMPEANPPWSLPRAFAICPGLGAMIPFWIEEPTHPEDGTDPATLARASVPP